MIIRKMTLDDLDAVNQLYTSVSSIHVKKRPDLFKMQSEQVYTEEVCTDVFEDEDAELIVAEEDGEVCGYAYYYFIYVEDDEIFTDKLTLRVNEICVSESHRHKGIGKKLMEYMRDVARERNCYDLTLFVYECNENAERFYENIGMQVRSSVMEWIV